MLTVLAAGYAAQASRGGPSQKTVQIALLGYNTTPHALAGRKATENAAKQYGAKVTFFNPNSDPQQQAVQLQDAIASGKYQALWIWALDGHRLQPLVKQAASKGIKVATGVGYELTAIAGVALGGTSIFGGVGSVWRTVVGVMLLGLITNGFNILGVEAFYQDIVKGGLIVAAVAVGSLVERR